MLRWRLTVPILIRRLTGTLGAARQIQRFDSVISADAAVCGSPTARFRARALRMGGIEEVEGGRKHRSKATQVGA